MRRGISILSILALLPAASADTSGPGPKPLRVFKDADGRVIRQVDLHGCTTLFTWDRDGRIVRMEGLVTPSDSTKREEKALSEAVWVHLFAYEQGRLSREVDCRGEEHVLPKGAQLDRRRATALPGHGHAPCARPSTRRHPAPKTTTFTYDNEGRLETVSTEENP